jgi:hypothetical protein
VDIEFKGKDDRAVFPEVPVEHDLRVMEESMLVVRSPPKLML